ncbi:MAG: hypothetical protein SGJ21_12925 [Alphaproteobacteria bacterium]|nr:hypothetical protein [Alphaproteobacteria bacterium]
MMGGANSKFFSRIVILAFVGVFFAACASMMTGQDASLFADLAI